MRARAKQTPHITKRFILRYEHLHLSFIWMENCSFIARHIWLKYGNVLDCIGFELYHGKKNVCCKELWFKTWVGGWVDIKVAGDKVLNDKSRRKAINIWIMNYCSGMTLQVCIQSISFAVLWIRWKKNKQKLNHQTTSISSVWNKHRNLKVYVCLFCRKNSSFLIFHVICLLTATYFLKQ